MHVVIIGNGISGISCARHIRKLSDHRITVISSESKHFYSRTALMYIYMGHMRFQDTKPYEDWFWSKNKIELVQDHVTAVDTTTKKLSLKSGTEVSFDKLVIATGSSSNKFNWPGQELIGVQGLYNLQDLQIMEENTRSIQRAVIVGGGLIGIEMAEMLRSRNIPVTFLVRENSFWNRVLPKEESHMINRHILEHGIDLQLSTELDSISGDTNGRVNGVKTKNGDYINCEFVGLAVGVHPNIDFLKGCDVPMEKGVLVNSYLETPLEDIYAIGDCAQFTSSIDGRRPIEQIWYTGKMQGVTLAHTICRNRTKYEPGHWFNSAKFFDIEYQTYGVVSAEPNGTQDSFYIEHHTGLKSIRLTYDKQTNAFQGMIAMGGRFRHHLMNQFLEEKRSIRYVVEHLSAANFDPEFYQPFESNLKNLFNVRFPNEKIESSSKRGWNAFNKLFQAKSL